MGASIRGACCHEGEGEPAAMAAMIVTAPESTAGAPSLSELGVLQPTLQSAVVEDARDPTSLEEAALAPDVPLAGKVTLRGADGSTYTGGSVDGRRHGYGEWAAPGRRKVYAGEWRNDSMHGNGSLDWADGRRYEGQFAEGAFSGHGKMEWNTEASETEGGFPMYEGQYAEDQKHGEGRFTWANGCIHEGQWVRGKRHGNGSYTDSKGELRTGNWKEGSLDTASLEAAPAPAAPLAGQATVRCADGSTYTGVFVEGRRHGYGEWAAPGRREVYSGEWRNDSMHGNGSLDWADGRRYEGQFVEGRFSGNGKMLWNTEASRTASGFPVYEGGFEEDKKHGEGRFTWADGCIHEGQWVRGKRHGLASYTDSKGGRRTGYWSNHALERWDELG